MTADKGQTPIRLAAGEEIDEAVYSILAAYDQRYAYVRFVAPDQARRMAIAKKIISDLSADTIATLTAQLAAAEARVAVAAEALEFYAKNWQPPANVVGRMIAPNVLYASTALLHDGGDRARASLHALTQETDNAD